MKTRDQRQEQLRDFGELFEVTPKQRENFLKNLTSDFDGVTYEPKFDATRLRGEMAHVYAMMKDGQWRTIDEIRLSWPYSETGISARLRDLRKAKFGGHTVNRRRRGDPRRGIFEYQLL